MEIKTIVCNQVPATLIKTNKFKTVAIEIVFLGEFTKANATKRSLLSRVMMASTAKYPTKKALTNRLFELYDATVSFYSHPSYRTNVSIFTMEMVNEKYLPDHAALTDEAVDFLKEVLFHPNAENGAWNEKDFNEQKRLLRESIANIYNHKSRYATMKMIETMCENEITRVNPQGCLEDLEPITPQDLYLTYLDLIKHENISIYVVGDFEEEAMIKSLSRLGDFPNNPKPDFSVQAEDIIPGAIKEKHEIQAINQSKLVMGFRSQINNFHPLHIPALVFNMMFGGTFSSDLVQVIREQNSLCYSIYSNLAPENKIMTINAGIDGENYQKVKSLIMDQLKRYQNGDLDMKNFSISKDLLLSYLSETEDGQESLLDYAIRNYVLSRDLTVSEVIRRISEVTIEQVSEVAKTLSLDTIFLLTNEAYHD
jgi:predicted Zn-dependent peptidase